MRHKGRTMMAALVAVLAFGVVASASASASAALPEFSAKTEFVGQFGSSLWNWNDKEFAFSSGAIDGEIPTTSTLSGVEVLFKGGNSYACTNPGPYKEGGELFWTKLAGKIGYLNKEKKQVGFLIGSSKVFAKCTIFALEDAMEFSGNLIGEITPVNTKTKKFTVNVSTLPSGKQEFTKLEGETADPLQSLGEDATVEIGEFTLTTSKEVELKA